MSRLTIDPAPDGQIYLAQHQYVDGDIAELERVIGRRVPLWSEQQGTAVSFNPPGLRPHEHTDGRPLRVGAFETKPYAPHPIPGVVDPHPQEFTIDRLIAGAYDTQLAEIAAQFRSYGRPMLFESVREANGILGKWFGGFGPDGDKPVAWAVDNESGYGHFRPSGELYDDLDPSSPDGTNRLIAGHRYYFDFFTRREGLECLTFHTNGWGTTDIGEKSAEARTPYGRALAEHLYDFTRFYQGDAYVDWVTITFHMIDWFADAFDWLSEDRIVSTEYYLGMLDAQMDLVRNAAPGKPVMVIECGFPDGMRRDSPRSAERVEAFFGHIQRYPEIRAVCLWADSPLWMNNIWPYDSLIRAGTAQGDALRAIVDAGPERFATHVHLSDGTVFS